MANKATDLEAFVHEAIGRAACVLLAERREVSVGSLIRHTQERTKKLRDRSQVAIMHAVVGRLESVREQRLRRERGGE